MSREVFGPGNFIFVKAWFEVLPIEVPEDRIPNARQNGVAICAGKSHHKAFLLRVDDDNCVFHGGIVAREFSGETSSPGRRGIVLHQSRELMRCNNAA